MKHVYMGLSVALLVCSGCRDAARPGGEAQPSAPAPGAASSVAAPAANGNWTTYNGSLSGERFSALDQVTTANVSGLRPVCSFDAPDVVSLQSGIVAVDGTLYVTAFNNTYAIDGRTCQQKWKHSRPEADTFLKVNRGVGYDAGRVFRGTGDGHVLALDASNGAVVWDVTLADPSKGESIPMAPVAWNGLVFVGNAGGDNFGVTGRIYGLDAGTGRTVWQFNSVPDSGPARATWQKASAANPPTGGATWTSYALDAQNAVLYVSTGNPGPDFVEQMRPGANLYSNSVLALEAKTGKLIAYVQPYNGDFHDWDLAAGPALFTSKSGRASIAAGSKDGYLYVIDRGSVKNAAGEAPDAISLAVRAKALTTTRENTEAPLTTQGPTRFCPGSQGGIEWNGPSHHAGLGLLYANAIDWCTSVKLMPIEKMKGAPGMPWTGMDHPQLAFGEQDPTDRWKGWISAVDAETGEVRWKVQTAKPMVAGITATGGGLVFTGDLDGNALAYDAQNGKELWRHAIGKPIGGGVISYANAGKQYIAVASGLNSPIWPVKGGAARVTLYALP
jgi:alcohol dehydrogenase (cytochrome c)